jgi:hypothetical protein
MSERETQGGDDELGRCHICGRTFSTQEELSHHLMDEHEERETLGDPRHVDETTGSSGNDEEG